MQTGTPVVITNPNNPNIGTLVQPYQSFYQRRVSIHDAVHSVIDPVAKKLSSAKDAVINNHYVQSGINTYLRHSNLVAFGVFGVLGLFTINRILDGLNVVKINPNFVVEKDVNGNEKADDQGRIKNKTYYDTNYKVIEIKGNSIYYGLSNHILPGTIATLCNKKFYLYGGSTLGVGFFAYQAYRTLSPKTRGLFVAGAIASFFAPQLLGYAKTATVYTYHKVGSILGTIFKTNNVSTSSSEVNVARVALSKIEQRNRDEGAYFERVELFANAIVNNWEAQHKDSADVGKLIQQIENDLIYLSKLMNLPKNALELNFGDTDQYNNPLLPNVVVNERNSSFNRSINHSLSRKADGSRKKDKEATRTDLEESSNVGKAEKGEEKGASSSSEPNSNIVNLEQFAFDINQRVSRMLKNREEVSISREL